MMMMNMHARALEVAVLSAVDVAKNVTSPTDSTASSSSTSTAPYEKTFAFFVINAIIACILYLSYLLVMKYKVNIGGLSSATNIAVLASSSSSTTSTTSIKSKSSSASSTSISQSPLKNDECDRWRDISDYLLIASTVFSWYSISLSFTVYNKWILQVIFGGFRFPLFQTTVHMIIKYAFSRLYVKFFMKPVDIPEVSTGLFWKVVVPIGITTSFDIAFSNEAISSISISLYTILKTTVVIWTFLWGCMFEVESFSLPKLICILLVIAGLAITVLDDLDSSLIGIVYCLLAAVSGGMRWVMVQVLCESDNSSRHPIVSMYRFSGSTVVAILPLALIVESRDIINSPVMNSNVEILEIIGLICLGGCLACLLMIVEIYLLTLTSSLTLSIFGEMKEVVQILFAVLVFHDQLSVQTCLGLLVVILSAELYRHIRKSDASLLQMGSNVDTKNNYNRKTSGFGGTGLSDKMQLRQGHLYQAVEANNDETDSCSETGREIEFELHQNINHSNLVEEKD